jgi:hypothetical protein
MPESFTTRQLAVIAAPNKEISWLFRITDNQASPNVYYWSTGTQAAGTGSIDIGAQLSPNTWSGSEWEYAHTFKIINFSGITLRRNKSESGIHAPNDVSFSIINPNVGGAPTYAASNFKGGMVRIALVADDGLGKEVIGSWRFVIKSASPYNQQIDVTCEDFLQQYLRGTYPNTRLISEIFPANTDNTIIKDNMCVPEVYGTAYIPLRSVYVGSARYYLLGPTTSTYTISEVRSPRATGAKITWTSPAFTMTQSTQTAPDTSTWRVFQPIIAASVGGGAVDSPGLWQNGDTFYDLPTKFNLVTGSVTNPADVIRRVLISMGVSGLDIDVDAARTTFTSWGLAWNFAFYYKEDSAKVLSKLLAMCNSCLVVGEQITLQVLSATSVKTITDVEVTKPSEDAPSSFKYTDSLAERTSDSGHVAYQVSGESQDLFLKALVPADSATDYPDSETIELPGVYDVDNKFVQKLGTLRYQRKLLKAADISANVKGTCLKIRPDDVITVNYVDFGGTYNALLDEVTINQDVSLSIRGIKFSTVLKDWADLNPDPITISTDGTTATYAPIYSGPDSPGTTNMPNSLRGRLKIGSEHHYILLEPNSPARVALYYSDVERLRFGNLNGYLDYVTNLYGIAIGDIANYLKYDPTNGLRISGAMSAGTISIGTSPNWFKVDASGNIWSGQDTLVNAQANTFAVTNAGALYAITGYLGGSTNGWQIAAGTLTSLGTGAIQTASSGARSVLNSSGLAVYDVTTQRAKIGSDGAGWLGASTTIAWTSAGVVTVAGFTTDATDLTKAAGGNTTIVSSGATAFTCGPTGSPTFTVTQAGVFTSTSGYIGGSTNGWGITAGLLTALGTGIIQTSASANTGIKIDSTSLRGYNGTVQTINIATDGSGWLGLAGTKAISWTTAGAATIAGWSLSASRISSTHVFIDNTGEYISFGATPPTAYGNNVGAWLGVDTSAKISLYADASNFFQWNGAALAWKGAYSALGVDGKLTVTEATVTGQINASSGTFSGNILVSGTLQTSATATLGFKFSSAGIKGYDAAGANVQTVEINHDGTGWFGTSAAKAISWTAAGVVTIGGFTANASALYTGSKSAYNDANAGVHFGTDGIGMGNNIFTVSAAGALVSTSATITGAVNATTGYFQTVTLGKTGTASGTLTLQLNGGTGDTYIAAGKTDFTNVGTAGFILGLDDSDSDKAKFYLGDATSYLNWDGTALTFTKGTLVENIIQMYTNVATLKTSATAGDGSASSAGMVVTYEGLFGCGANQTATIAAADANVRILATGAAFFSGTVSASSVLGSYLYGSSLMTKGTYLSSTCLAADATLNVGDTTDFAASGSASFIDSANDRDVFTYTGKTAITLTGCSGVLAHTVSATNRPLVVPAVKGIYISDVANEMRFFGNQGDGTIAELASIGTSSPLGDIIGTFGNAYTSRMAVYGGSHTETGVYGRSEHASGVIGSSGNGYGIKGLCTNGPGVYAYSENSQALYVDGISVMNGGLHVGGTSDAGNDNLLVDGTATFTGVTTLCNGLNYIGDSANANMTVGLTINQGANDNEIISLKSSDDVHGITTISETDTYGFFSKLNSAGPNTSGLLISGLTGTGTAGLALHGYAPTADTSTSTSSYGGVRIDAFLKNGTGVQSYGNGDNIFTVANNGAAQFMVKGNGDFNYNGTGTAYDIYDDALACQDLSMNLSNQLSKVLKYNKIKLHEMGVIAYTIHPSGKEDLFVSRKGMDMLQLGAIGELYRVCNKLCERQGITFEEAKCLQ